MDPLETSEIALEDKEGPVIICGNHANQFIDALLLFAFTPRKVSFVMAASSFKKPIIGHVARLMKAIPVDRPQDFAKAGKGSILHIKNDMIIGEGTEFMKLSAGETIKIKTFSDDFIVKKAISDTELLVTYAKPFEKLNVHIAYQIIPKLDQSQLYSAVWDLMKQGGCLGIFPEGGSHDRTEFLPLKAGVCIMSLGAMNAHKIGVKIISCGLNYYKGHKFRSKALVEFGPPYDIPQELAARYSTEKREAISELLSTVEKLMRGVTIRAPTYSELRSVYLARDLYVPETERLTPEEEYVISRRLAQGYNKFKDHPEVEKLFTGLKQYRLNLKSLGLSDGQALPGLFLNVPIGLFARYLAEQERKKALKKSTVKIVGADVIASQKVVCAVVAFPIASFVWTFCFFWLLKSQFHFTFQRAFADSLIFFFLWPVYCYMAVLSYDGFVRQFKRLVALLYLILRPSKLSRLLEARRELKEKLTEFINKHGTEVVEDFDNNRIVNNPKKKKQHQIEIDKAFEILQELGI